MRTRGRRDFPRANQSGTAEDGQATGQAGSGPILFIANGLGPGGAERQLVYLSLGLRERGWNVRILTLTPAVHPEFSQKLQNAGVPVTSLQSDLNASISSLLRAFSECRRQVREVRPAVLIGFLVHGSLFARIIGTLLAVPKIITSLRSTHSRRPWHDSLLALTRRLDDVVVTNSAEAAEAQLRARVTTAEKSVVIANGFDLSRVAGSQVRVVPRPGDAFIWLAIAGFRPEKGHAVLLRAAAILSDRRSFRLVLAGDGPELDKMKALAAQLHIKSRLDFVGNRDDIASLIHSADAFVLPSAQEGLPNALIEALAGGLPTVSTDVGGCRGLIEAGGSGYLVPPGDPEQLAAAMKRLMDLPPETRRAMGNGGRHVVERFSMEAMISSWAALL